MAAIITREGQVTLPPVKRLIERFMRRFPITYRLPLRLLGKEIAPWPPEIVKIETTNHCNAVCVYCPRDAMTRPKGLIDEAIFRKLVDECAAEGVKSLHLQNFGEPLLDKMLPDRIR
ncbi:MAG: hypothetical protein ACE5H5_03925, partial [Nitrospinota bacterium]